MVTKNRSKVYYAHVAGEAGTIARLDDGEVYFWAEESGILRHLPLEEWGTLIVLGDYGLAEAQAILDHMHGGAARIACTRRQEVQ
jgi:hypothetical protein